MVVTTPAMNLHPGNFHRSSSRIPYIGQPNTGNKRGVQMHHRERESREVGRNTEPIVPI